MKLTKQMRKDIEAWLKHEAQEGTCPFEYGAKFRGIDKCKICSRGFNTGNLSCPCFIFGVEHVRKVAKKALKTGELCSTGSKS
jgi:hypothetical protein